MTAQTDLQDLAPASLASAPRPAVAVGHSVGVFGSVSQGDAAMAIWRRAMPRALADWADGLPPHLVPEGRVLIAPAECEMALRAIFRDCGTPADPGADAFVADAGRLVAAFAEASGSGLVDMRVEHVRHDACWKFHCDRVRLRLLCTYRGPGTQYVPACHAGDALRLQVGYRGPLQSLPRFSAALFRGSEAGAGQDGGQQGVVHRSPPIQGSGVSRLLLCLNEPSIVSPPRFAG